MMSGHSNGSSNAVQQISLSYNTADAEASALRLVLSLFPEWDHQAGKIEFIRFTDGITNTLLKAIKRRPGLSEEQIDKEAVLLRAYGKGTEILIDREKEATSHSLLSQHLLAPPLLARFENGLIYRFIEGRVCASEDLVREPVWRGVARRLGQWHGTLPIASAGHAALIQDGGVEVPLPNSAPDSLPCPERINAITLNKPIPNVWTIMQKWIFALSTTTGAETARKALLQRELERSVAELGDLPGLGSNGLVFGHTDLLSGNIIVQPRVAVDKASKAESVSFIDYEYAVPAPAAFDIANHFAEWGGFACNYSVLPTRSQRLGFIKEYIDSYASHSDQKPSQSLVSQLFEEVDLFRGIPGLYWGIWALIQAKISQIEFNYANYAEVRLAEYWAWRAEDDGSRKSDGKEMPLRERRWAEE